MQTTRFKYAGLGLWQIFFIALLFGCSKDDDLPFDCDFPKAADTYVYPVVPGTPEWVSLNTTTARWEACQIPDNQLKAMSTAGLIDSWRDFPFTIEIYVASSFQRGIAFLITEFSGLQELCRRDDAGVKLLEQYKRMQPACVTTHDDEKSKGDFSLSFPPIELLLAQDTILNKLSPAQKKDLIKEALLKYADKKQYPETFGLVAGTAMPLFICIRTLKNAGYQPFIAELDSNTSLILTTFYDTGRLFTTDYNAPEIHSILKHADNFIK